MAAKKVQSSLVRFRVYLKNTLSFLLRLPRLIVIGLIILYQKTLSPDHGVLHAIFPHGYCKFYPTCSEYGKLALQKYGLVRGLPMTVWRVIRCNPWSKGGEDWP